MIKDSIASLIQKTEGLLGIDLAYYARNNSYLLIAQAVILLCGLASSIVLTRLLSQDTYGQYNYIFSVIGILAIFSIPGMGAAIMHATANKHDQVLITGTKIRLKWSLIGAMLCLSVGLYHYFNGEMLLGKSFMGASLLFPLFTSFDNFYPFLNGRKRFDLSSRYRSIYWIGLTLAVMLAVYITRNLFWVVTVYMVTATTIEAFFLFKTIRTGNLSKSEDKGALTYGKQLTGLQAMGIAAQQFDKLIVGLALGFSQLAVYSIAVMISNIPYILVQAVSTTIFPKLAVMEKGAAYSEVKKRLPWLLAGIVIICGIGAVLSPYVIPWLYTSKYFDSVLYTQLLFIPVIMGTPSMLLRRGVLQAQKKTSELFRLNLIVSLFELAVMVILALQFGVIGIIAARALAKAFDSGYAWWLTR